MILADKIINERKRNGWSQEELAEMLDVSRQSVSKWEGAQSIPDLQKILKMADLFGVSTDYLLKDEFEAEDRPASGYEEQSTEDLLRKVSLEEASEYISLRKRILPAIAAGVVLCITSPVVLILLSGLQSSGVIKISEGAAAAVGLVFLFVQIGIAVYLFISKSGPLKKYEFLENERLETGYGVDGMVREKLATYATTASKALTAGVLMCIMGSVPLIVCSVLNMSSVVIVSMVCLLLILVACAVYMFIAIVGFGASYKILLQTDDYSPERKRKENKLAPLTRVYWLLVVCIYLAVSFITMRWDRTWIIWAVSGVLFAVVRGIAEAVIRTGD
ncbi:MAG: helix-turn-helix transcriptional regulator [Lachnospiraceae bacterium]|nr:helix-turn-helix transcriptional regulator [Lachnospiraceae bacterium]